MLTLSIATNFASKVLCPSPLQICALAIRDGGFVPGPLRNGYPWIVAAFRNRSPSVTSVLNTSSLRLLITLELRLPPPSLGLPFN